MKKRWRVEEADKGLQAELGRRLNILPITAQLLINRGLVDHDRASSFLRPELKDLHDPFLLKGMDKAAARAVEAILRRETAAIYGDYDVDGTCAAAVLHGFFIAAGIEPVVYIPHRQKEGYGLNKGALDELKSRGVTLVITVDCGMSNALEVKYASSLGMDVIVTDHHEPGAEPPDAYAVVNPKQKGCPFPFKGLAGVGVAFNLIMALRALLRKLGRFSKTTEPNLLKYTDLVSVGTVADMVPLLDENRVLVSYGLKELASSSRPGLEALKEVSALREGRLDADVIAFQLAPRINAAGRLSKADVAFRLLTTEDAGEARSLAAELDSENSRRQKLEAEMFKDALSMLQPAPTDKGIVLYSEAWHPGVVGIVASRLVERFSRPAVVISLNHGVGKGSARGTRSFDMLEGLDSCAGFLTRYGGHRMAAGLTVDEKNLSAFRDEFLKFANLRLTDEDMTPELRMDAVVSIGELGVRLVTEIETLAPFGVANRTPLFCLRNARIAATEVVGSRHLRFVLSHQGVNFRGIGFGMAPMHPLEGDGFAVAFSPFLEEWRGERRLGLKIKDVEVPANILT